MVVALAQLPEGVWVSSHELRVGNYLDIDGQDEQLMRMMKQYLLEDSVYAEGGWVLDVDTSNNIRFLKDIRSDIIQHKFRSEREKLVFGRDSFRVEFADESKLLLIRQFMDSIWHEFHFHRLPPSTLNEASAASAFPKPGAHMRLNVSDTLSRGYQLDFMDDRQLVITGMKDGMLYTVRGIWHSRWIGKVLFFSFFDNHFEKMQLYYFYGDSVNGLVGGTFNNAEALGGEPQRLQTTMTIVETPNSSQLSEIRNDLVGSWEAINEPLFYDPAIEFGFLSYQSFEITLNADGSFRMSKSGTVLKHGDSIPLEESSVAEWEVSPTGKYLIITPPDDIPFYLSIHNAGPQKLDVYYFMKTLSEFPNYNVFQNRKVELRRL